MNDPVSNEDGVGFLQRWSQRKANASNQAAAPADADASIDPSAGVASPADALDADAAIQTNAEAPATEPASSVTESDLEGLTYDSDYTKFMADGVPEALRRRALRQLWRSDPILANVDGLCDYDDDFTDAALAVKVLQTAHRVGQGYLTDEEVSANRARGGPEEPDDASDDVAENDTEQVVEFEDDAEDIEDEDGGVEVKADDGDNG
jgi:hypothetical protein